MLRLQHLTKTYAVNGGPPLSAVEDVTLEVSRGEFVVLTGRSGSGKTTLLNLAAGLTKPTAGQVLLDGGNLWDLKDQKRAQVRNRKIGFVFQFPSLLPALTVLENVLLPMSFGAPDGGDGARRRAIELLDMLGLSEKRHAYPRQLSAGQQQRAVIVRALISQPALLLADEPTSNLDEQTELEIMALFREIHQQTGQTIVLVTHSSQLVGNGSRMLHMVGGRLQPAGLRLGEGC